MNRIEFLLASGALIYPKLNDYGEKDEDLGAMSKDLAAEMKAPKTVIHFEDIRGDWYVVPISAIQYVRYTRDEDREGRTPG